MQPTSGTHPPTDATRFLLLCGQLGLLLAVFWVYHIEDPVFFSLSVLAFAGFAVHYWLPARWKEQFFVALSIAGAFIVLEPLVAVLVLATGGVIYGITRLPISWRARLALLLILTIGVMLSRSISDLGIPSAFWPTLGALFMFRLAIYMYALKHAPAPLGFWQFATYFFMLPNFYFLFFPVVDLQTMRKSFLRRDIHDVAQQGILWLVRGTAQLLLYRVITQLRGSGSPAEVRSFALLVQNMVLTYLLYLKVSGSFHIIVGLIRLFGYDLPETHRRWLLARTLTDFWRRINIYWKDFMVTLVYLPIYFRLRKGGEIRAQLVGTAIVFVVTWLLHAWQYWWLSGRWLLTGPDTLFWGFLGALVVANVYVEARQRRRVAPSRWVASLQTVGTLSLIVFLWTLWSSPSLKAWVELITYRAVG